MPAQSPPTRQIVAKFTGVNPMAPSHMLPDDEVQTATNVDFSAVIGAIVPRQGCVLNTNVGVTAIGTIFNNYNSASSIGNGAMYLANAAGVVYRRPLTSAVPGAATSIMTGANASPEFPPAIGSYKQYALIAGGASNYKDDGTNTTEWIKQVPAAPVVTINTLTAKDLTYDGFVVTQGSLVTGSSTCTFYTDATNFGATIIDTFTGAPVNLNLNGTETIGSNAMHSLTLAFDNPALITGMSWDYSIGDATFVNYFHSEIVVGTDGIITTVLTPQQIIDNNIPATSTLSIQDRQNIVSIINNFDTNAQSVVINLARTDSPWLVPVSNFTYIGNTSIVDPWTKVYALRISFKSTGVNLIVAKNPAIYGAERFPLTDNGNGYLYWQTYATLDDNGNKIDESANSPAAGPYTMQNANTTVVTTGTATGSIHGINAVITYRQGGFMADAYAINTHTYSTTTFTDTTNDIIALNNNFVMSRGLMAPSNFPGTVAAISKAYRDRIFIADGNLLRWTLPGQVGSIPLSSVQEVSSIGDNITGILEGGPGLIIVNRASIYELYGNNFEAGDFTLQRTGAHRGSVAIKTLIQTPYGIPLLNPDSLTMFVPGYNTEQTIGWFNDKYADFFKGNQSTDPAAWKGSRIPALNNGYAFASVAAFQNNKLYLACPTGSSTTPNTLLVLDFLHKQAFWYTYPFNISSLLVDSRSILFWAGTDNGAMMVLEYSTKDQTTSGTNTSITWTARTKQWTADTTTVLENLAVDAEGTNIQLKAYYDNSTNPTLGTITNSVRSWTIPPLNGTFVNAAAFDISGTSSGTGALSAVYEMKFDLLSEPPKVRYWRTEYDEHNWQADKLWDVHYADIDVPASGTVTYVSFVDGTAVMTNTIIGPTSGRQVFEVAYPAETYGRVAYTTYTAATPIIKHWETRMDARNEPAKVNYWRTDIQSLDENIVDAFDVDINPNGTVLGTIFVDNVAIMTATITGSSRQSYTYDVPISSYPLNTYGRTLYILYTGSGLKHYNTWFHLRKEPDRWTEFISTKETGDEREIKVFEPELDCLGNTVLGTTYLDGTAVSTHTITGSVRKQYTFSLPVEKYARTVHAAYQAVSGRFKHYSTMFEGPKEPPRVTLFRIGPFPYDSDHYLKTWLARLDPLSGTVTGSLFVNDTLIQTSTFTGSRQQWFTIGIDLVGTNSYVLQTGSRWEAVYSCSSGQFKHYESKMDSDADPYRKIYYSFNYRKIGGASQVDLGKFWSMEAVVPNTTNDAPVVATYWWDIDNVNFCTGTLSLEEGNQFYDRIPFPPGARGRLFQFRMYCPYTVKIAHVNIDLMEEGIKNLTRRGHPGSPEASQQ